MEFLPFLQAQAAFSEATFGPGQRTQGVLAHLRKELDEIARDPLDRTEWMDVVLLALDGARRAGYPLEALVTGWPGGPAHDLEVALERQFGLAQAWFEPSAGALEVVLLLEANLRQLDDAPGLLTAWLGVASLAFEGGRRTGATAADLLGVLTAKFERNRRRTWPDWRTQPVDRPIEHVRAHD